MLRFFRALAHLFQDAGRYWSQPPQPATLDLRHSAKALAPLWIHRTIPRILHQTCASADVSWDIYAATQQLKGMNSEYDYRFYTDADCLSALVARFGADAPQVRAFQMLRVGAYKADLFRLCILYAVGGVYMDCKATTIQPIRSFLPRDVGLVVVLDVDPRRIQTGAFLAAKPHHPIIERMMNEAVARILRREYGQNYLDIAGPEHCGCVFRAMVEKETVQVGDRLAVASGNVLVLGAVRLFDFYVYDRHQRPILKLQHWSYFLSWRRLWQRYEWAWAFGRVYN